MRMTGATGAWRRWTLMVAVVLAMTGCGGGSDPVERPSSSPTPEPVPTYTLDQLAAALPGVDDVPGGTKVTFSCPGDEECESDAASITVDMLPSIPAAEAERDAKTSALDDYTYVRATSGEDDAAAVAKVEKDRDEAQQYAGDYKIAAKSESKSRFVPGEEGTGSVEDVTVSDWTGIVLAHTGTWLAPDGFDTFDQDGDIETTALTLSRGASVLKVQVVVKLEHRKPGDAGTIARQLAKEYIARLDS